MTKPPVRLLKVRSIKYYMSYSAEMLSETLNVDIQTVRRWQRKEGLKPIDNQIRPILFHGSEVIRFAKEKNARNKMSACALNEMTCFKCKAPRIPACDAASIFPQSPKVALMVGVCSVCNTALNKTISLKNMPAIEKLLKIQQIDEEGLINFRDHPAMSHFSIHGRPKRKLQPKTIDNDGQMSFFINPEHEKEGE